MALDDVVMKEFEMNLAIADSSVQLAWFLTVRPIRCEDLIPPPSQLNSS
jgi:hypothetical protein